MIVSNISLTNNSYLSMAVGATPFTLPDIELSDCNSTNVKTLAGLDMSTLSKSAADSIVKTVVTVRAATAVVGSILESAKTSFIENRESHAKAVKLSDEKAYRSKLDPNLENPMEFLEFQAEKAVVKRAFSPVVLQAAEKAVAKRAFSAVAQQAASAAAEVRILSEYNAGIRKKKVIDLVMEPEMIKKMSIKELETWLKPLLDTDRTDLEHTRTILLGSLLNTYLDKNSVSEDASTLETADPQSFKDIITKARAKNVNSKLNLKLQLRVGEFFEKLNLTTQPVTKKAFVCKAYHLYTVFLLPMFLNTCALF